MPKFHYVAKSSTKETLEGTVEAETKESVFDHLSKLGYVPVKIFEEAGETKKEIFSSHSKVPSKQIRIFIRQFASLIRSSVPVLRSLEVLKEQSQNNNLKRILEEMINSIKDGESLSGAMGNYPGIFQPLFTSLVHSGEVSGTLDSVLDNLAGIADKEEALKSKIRSALAYPVFVMITGIGTVTFIMVYVMPKLLVLFQNYVAVLPLPTRILLATTHLVTQLYFWIGLIIIILCMFLAGRLFSNFFKGLLANIGLKLPIVGALVRKIELSRFCRVFGILIEHGVPVFRSTDIALSVVDNPLVKNDFSNISAGLKEGASLAQCLRQTSFATPIMINTLAVGEEHGKLGEAFMEISNMYGREIDQSLQMLSALLEPILILAVGIVVGFIVMAVMLPIFEISLAVR